MVIGYVDKSGADAQYIPKDINYPMDTTNTGADVVYYDSPPGNSDPWYVTGSIVDKAGQLVQDVTIRLYLNSQPITDSFLVKYGSYEAWTDHSPYEVYVVFEKEGFQSQKIQFKKLIDAADVIMRTEGDFPYWQIALVLAAVAIYMTRKGKKKMSGFTTGDAFNIVLIIGGIIAFTTVIKILRKLGFLKDPKIKDQETDPNSAWKPGYWQQFSTYSYAITEATAGEMAKKIHNAFTLFQDDWNAIYGVFSQMRTKANVSFLSWKFNKQYGEDLLTFLQDGGGILPWDGLSDSHMVTLIELVKNLPTN